MTKYLLFILLLATGCTASPQPSSQSSAQPLAQPLPKPSHVVIVIEENKSYEDIIGSKNAPYINGLAKVGASLDSFYAFHHPSQPNYFELFAATHTLAITEVVPVTINDVESLPQPYSIIDDTCAPGLSITPSLGGLLGKKFLGYGEDWDPAKPFACLEGTSYARKHLPWTGFLDSIAASRTFTDFKTLSQTQSFDQLPLVSMVIPNLIDDMHSLPGSNGEGNNIPTLVKNGDTWLQQNLDGYVKWAMSNNSLLIVTWDENSLGKEEGHDNGKGFAPPKNRISTILVGQMVKPGSISNTIYNHYDLLRTIEDMYGLRPYLGGSATANDITDIWK